MGSNMRLDEATAHGRLPFSRRVPRFLKGSCTLIVLLFWTLLIQRSWSDLSSRQWHLDLTWTGVALAAFALYFVGQAMAWALLTRALGYTVPIGSGMGIWLLSMPARYVPGNVWHIAARADLARSHSIAPEGVLTSSAVEQALMVLSATCLGLAWQPVWNQSLPPSTVAILLVCLAILQPPVLQALLRFASRRLQRPIPTFNLGYRQMALIFLIYAVVNGINGLALYLLAVSIASAPLSMAPALAAAYCLAYVAGYLSFLTPSGLGVREAVLASMLTLYMPVSAAVTLSLAARIFSTGGEALAVVAVGLPTLRLARSR